jgi:hypothetical protein
MKTTILTIVNSLLLGIIAPNILDTYLIAGYKTQTIFAAFIGSVIGTIICTQYKIQKLFVWLLLGIGLLTIAFFYGQLVLVNLMYVPPGLAYMLLVFLLLFFIGFSYLLAFFELFIANLFSSRI